MLTVTEVSPDLGKLQERAGVIATRRQQLADRKLELQRARHDQAEDYERRVEQRVADLLGSSDVLPPEPVARDYDQELASLEQESTALNKARNLLGEQIARARRAASKHVAAELRPQHRAAAAKIVSAVELLFTAFNEQAAVFAQLRHAGADPEVMPAFGIDPRVKASLDSLAQECRRYVGQ